MLMSYGPLNTLLSIGELNRRTGKQLARYDTRTSDLPANCRRSGERCTINSGCIANIENDLRDTKCSVLTELEHFEHLILCTKI